MSLCCGPAPLWLFLRASNLLSWATPQRPGAPALLRPASAKIAGVDSVFLQHPMEGRAAHAEVPGRLADIAPGLQESVEQGLPLGLAPGLAQGRRLARAREHRNAEVGRLDEAPGGHDDGALDGVLQFADVARPAVGRD